jgi:hypothetical protein
LSLDCCCCSDHSCSGSRWTSCRGGSSRTLPTSNSQLPTPNTRPQRPGGGERSWCGARLNRPRFKDLRPQAESRRAVLDFEATDSFCRTLESLLRQGQLDHLAGIRVVSITSDQGSGRSKPPDVPARGRRAACHYTKSVAVSPSECRTSLLKVFKMGLNTPHGARLPFSYCSRNMLCSRCCEHG